MANIPLTQIPNAPQTGNSAVMTDVSAIRAPNLRGAGQLVAQGAQMLQQARPLSAAAFDTGGMGAGIESLGDSGTRASAALGDFAVRLGRAHDEAQMAELDSIKHDVVSRYEQEILTKPADQWESVWQRYDAQLADGANKLRMSSPLSSGKMESTVKSLRMKTAAEVKGSAAKATVESYRKSLGNYIDRAVEDGRHEDAFGAISRGVAAGLYSKEDGEAAELKIERVVKWENVTGSIQASPHEVVRDLEGAVANGTESKLFKSLKTPSDRAKALNMAYSEQRRMDGATVRDAVEEIFTGSITDPAQIDERFSTLDRKDRESLKATLEATPEQIAKRLKTAPAVQQMINAYDPQDDFDGTKAITVRQFVKQLPEGYQRDYLDQLNDKIRNNKPEPPTAVKEIRSLAEKDFAAMRYGKWKEDKDTGEPSSDEEYAKRDAAMLSYSREMTAFDRWAKRNPEATDEEAYGEINRIRRNIYEAEKADGKESARMPNMTAPDPRDVQRKARQLRGQPQASTDGVYREGNIGPTSTGPHFDIKREDRGHWDRGTLDAYVLVNGEPLSTGKTVSGGQYGAPRSYGQHKGWDFAFGGKGNLTLTNGAVWLGVNSTQHGDKARFQTPDGAVYEILHGKFDSAS